MSPRFAALPRSFACLVAALALSAGPGVAQVLTGVPESELHVVARFPTATPDYALDAVRQVMVGPEGRLLVRDDARVLELDRAEGTARWVGEAGNGARPFRRIRSMGLLGDTLWVVDLGRQHVVWLREGREVRAEPLHRDGPRLTDIPGTFLSDGTVLTAVHSGDDLVIVRRLRTGQVVESVGSVRTADAGTRIEDDQGGFTLADPFAATVLEAPAPGGRGMAFVERPRPEGPDSAAFRVLIHVGGRTQSRIVRYRPAAVTPAERALRDRVLEAFAPFLAETRQLERREVEALLEEHAPVPEYGLPVLGALMDPSGWTWLHVADRRPGARWVALDRSGVERLGIRLPPGERLQCVAGRTLVAYRPGDEAPALVVYEADLSRVEGP